MHDVVHVDALRRNFGGREALAGVSFNVRSGETFGLLGPNGGGKTTLFRILTTLLAPTSGSAAICGYDVLNQRGEARRRIGVVFQSPSLDIYLTARENLRHSGHLYGLGGRHLESRIDSVITGVGLRDRADDLVKTFSGGMRRRVEIAKGILHEPEVLILDEPSTGLDPGARRELWNQLQALRKVSGVTILMTTHFMDEADRCDRLAILDRGALVACGTPAELKARIGGDCVTIQCDEPIVLAGEVTARVGSPALVVDGLVRIETTNGPAIVSRLMAEFSSRVHAVTLGKPTLEDVFVHETGHRFMIDASPEREGRP